jgi:hypothetical protein
MLIVLLQYQYSVSEIFIQIFPLCSQKYLITHNYLLKTELEKILPSICTDVVSIFCKASWKALVLLKGQTHTGLAVQINCLKNLACFRPNTYNESMGK